MACPYCQGDATQEMERTTALGYRLFRCRPCRRTFNERTGTPFNHLQVPTDVALLVVLWRLRYKLSLRDLAEMFLTRGFTFTHETVREWEERFTPLLTERLRAKRRGKAGKKWHADETYVRVDGRWCYLYRAIDVDGNLVDSMLSETRDMDAAKRFFTRARTVVGAVPEKVTTDGHDAYPRAIRETLGPDVQHQHQSLYEQPHGAGPSGHQATLLSDAWLRLVRLSGPLLHGPRRTARPSPLSPPPERVGVPGRAAPPVPGAVGRGVRRAGGRVGASRQGQPQPNARNRLIVF